MKKTIIIFALVISLGTLLLMAGCVSTQGYYDLSSWSPPSDAAFTSFVNNMDSPAKITSWINGNCTFVYNNGTCKSPYEFWKTKSGDCSEAAALCSYCLHENGYNTYQTHITYTTGNAHRICIYKVGSGYQYTTYSNNPSGCYYHPSSYTLPSYRACVNDWDNRSPYTVSGYTVWDWNYNAVETSGDKKVYD